jgi:hypothetical protein
MLSQQELMKRIMEINKDASLNEDQKASARQDLMSGKWKLSEEDKEAAAKGKSWRHRLPAALPSTASTISHQPLQLTRRARQPQRIRTAACWTTTP